MTEFKKYKSIENHYQTKAINYAFDKHPEYISCKYHVQEKIDGSNIQIKFTVTDDAGAVEVEYGKRNSLLTDLSELNGFSEALTAEAIRLFIAFNTSAMSYGDKGDCIIFYGELFGKGIQNRINYGDGKYIRFYDCWFNGEYITQESFMELMVSLDIPELIVPSYGVYSSFEQAMEFDVESKLSDINPVDGNFIEGVVIKPWDVIAVDSQGQKLFYVKHKSEKFAEVMKSKKVKVARVVSKEFQDALDTFTSYVNDNRLKSVFSKEGEIEKSSDMGKYIKWLSIDAREDYMKDHNEQFMKLTDTERSGLFKIAGRIGAKLMKEYL